MKFKFKIKDIFLYTLIIVVELIIIDMIIRPSFYFDMKPLEEKYKKFHQAQKIAPSRLYINAWRYAKIQYADETMNNQDWNRWRNRYSSKIRTLDDADVAINTMLASLNDSYTKFLQANLYAKQKQILDSRITGIGLVFNKTDDGIVVNKVLKNSSARENKVMSGDKIVSVNGVDVKNLSVQEIQDIIDKTENDDIKITLKRGEEYSQKELKRTEIPVDTMAYKISESNIAEIKLANVLGKNALSDFEKIIKATNNANVIILDLRNNYGGLLSNAVQMADMMLSKKKILDIKSRGKTKYEIFSDKHSIFKEKPIIILVNEKTASAAEILTGALKNNLEVYVVGENTFGKNTIQYIVPMANRTGLVITSDKYILPNGEDISEIGIKPDIKLEKFNDEDYKKTIDKLVEKIMENKK